MPPLTLSIGTMTDAYGEDKEGEKECRGWTPFLLDSLLGHQEVLQETFSENSEISAPPLARSLSDF